MPTQAHIYTTTRMRSIQGSLLTLYLCKVHTAHGLGVGAKDEVGSGGEKERERERKRERERERERERPYFLIRQTA